MSAKNQGGGKKHPQQQKGFKGSSKGGSKVAAASTGKKSPAEPQEKYVVLVHNVENQLDTIHNEAVARHLGLNMKLIRSNNNTNASGSSSTTSPNYKVTVRTETRSAQVDVFFDDEQGAEELMNAPLSTTSEDKEEKKEGQGDASTTTSKRGKRSRSVTDVLERAKGKRYFGMSLKTRASTDGERAVDNKDAAAGGASVGGALAMSSTGEAMHSTHIVGVGCNTNVALGAKQLHNILTDIPGFISCWKTHQPKKFRCVFESEQVLFSAKPLLDQFEVEGVKITLNIPDSLTERFNDFVAARTE